MRRIAVLSLVISLSLCACSAPSTGGGDVGVDARAPQDAADIAVTDVANPTDAITTPDVVTSMDAASDATSIVDLDHDGLDDAFEDRIAREYLPYRSFHTSESCPLQFILFRVRPHPNNPALLHLIMDTLMQNDCGAGGHVGDDEVFAMTVDPSMPAPSGIVAMRAISHQGTVCQHVSDCGRCTGLTACDTAMRGGVPFPVVYYSRDKHGAYLTTASCNGACFFTNSCDLNPVPNVPPMLNAGEPTAPLTHDLTASGMITAASGWTEMSLFNYDPWSGMNFGGAGNVASDLDDPAFLTGVCP